MTNETRAAFVAELLACQDDWLIRRTVRITLLDEVWHRYGFRRHAANEFAAAIAFMLAVRGTDMLVPIPRSTIVSYRCFCYRVLLVARGYRRSHFHGSRRVRDLACGRGGSARRADACGTFQGRIALARPAITSNMPSRQANAAIVAGRDRPQRLLPR